MHIFGYKSMKRIYSLCAEEIKFNEALFHEPIQAFEEAYKFSTLELCHECIDVFIDGIKQNKDVK